MTETRRARSERSRGYSVDERRAAAKAPWINGAYKTSSFLLVGLFLAQGALAVAIITFCVYVIFGWEPDFVRRFDNDPIQALGPLAYLVVGAVVNVASGAAMLARKRWGPTAYMCWAVLAIGLNAISPRRFELLAWPFSALLASIGVFYLAFQKLEDRVFVGRPSPPPRRLSGVLKSLAIVFLDNL